MAYGLNKVMLIGRLGADAVVNSLTNGGRVANISVATDEGYISKDSGERVDKTEWHRVVTFQDGMVTTLEKHATKGRQVYVEGKLQTRKWTDAEGERALLDRDPDRSGRAHPVPGEAEPRGRGGAAPRGRPAGRRRRSRRRDPVLRSPLTVL